MTWDFFGGINLFLLLVTFTFGGFVIGYLIGYVWAHMESGRIVKRAGLNDPGTESAHDYANTKFQESVDIYQITFKPMPTAHQSWKHAKVYAKGA